MTVELRYQGRVKMLRAAGSKKRFSLNGKRRTSLPAALLCYRCGKHSHLRNPAQQLEL